MSWYLPSARDLRVGMLSALVLLATSISYGQIEITEVMSDSLSSEPKWEWMEVRNIGGSAIDLDGYVLDDDDGTILAMPNISVADGPTSVPAGGVAVIYNGTQFGFDAQLFRDAWQIGGGVPLIGLNSTTGFNNGGDRVGLWPSYTDYLNDSMDDGMGNLMITSFNNVAADVDYATFPGAGSGVTQYYLGSGDYRLAANWSTSVDGTDGAVTSIEITSNSPINSLDDLGNPGVVAAGPQAQGLLISEIMYNPDSPEDDWEWVEVVNNTGSAIDFSATNYFLDDEAGGALGAANITTGSVADGEIAILYNDDLPPADFATAWGGGLNAIPVSSWSALNNGGDTVALWNNSAGYNTDRTNGNFMNAEAFITYDDDGVNWPQDDNMASIHRTDLSTFNNGVGSDWTISFTGDGLSFNASAVNGTVIEHVGGDVGSPGFVPGGGGPVIDADFNDDTVIDGTDIDLLTMDLANGTNDVAMFDLDGSGSVTFDDVIQWLADAGAANLLSGNPYLMGDANLDGNVDGQDFVRWNDSKFTFTGKWTMGDFNANGPTDGQDFVIWNDNKFMSADGAGAVPEPASTGLWAILTLCLCSMRCRT